MPSGPDREPKISPILIPEQPSLTTCFQHSIGNPQQGEWCGFGHDAQQEPGLLPPGLCENPAQEAEHHPS